MLQRSQVDLNAQLDLLFNHHPQWALAQAELPRPLADEVVQACSTVVSDTPQALFELAEKLKRIADGQFAEGDMPFGLKRAVVLVALGAVLVGTPGGPIVLPALASYGLLTGSTTILSVLAWQDLGKKKEPKKNKKRPPPGDFKL